MNNIAVAKFSDSVYTVSTPLWRYDYGQVLKIEGLPLPDPFEVHFSHAPVGTAKYQIGRNGQVTIPDEFLTKSGFAYAWIFLHTGEDDGETRYQIKIPVRERAKPTDTPLTPEEQSLVTQLIAVLNDKVEEAQDAADQAEEAQLHYPMVGLNGNWFVWNVSTGSWVDTGVHAQGDAGFSPTITSRVISVKDHTTGEVRDGVLLIITNETGRPQTVQILDGRTGAKGDKGDKGDTGAQGPKGDSGLTNAVKNSLLTIAEKAGYSDTHGQDYYDALYAALYPPAELLSITASFAQGSHVVYDTDTLESLKPYLTVTGTYDDGTSKTISNYTLSGTLTEGTSTITVTAGGKTTTFTVTVTEYDTQPVIQTEGVCWSMTAGQTVAKEGFGITKWYPFSFTQEALEACQYWDAENGYMTMNGWAGVRYYTADVNTLAGGYSWPGSANYKNLAGIDSVGTFISSITKNAEYTFAFPRYQADAVRVNGVSFTIPLLDADDCYAYWNKPQPKSILPTGVNEGDIIFAGKNTPYYKLHNISEASGT